MTTPGNTPQAPCGWLPDAPCLTAPGGPCCPDISNPVIGQRAKDLAALILWRLTGYRYGCCELTVRPCKPETCESLELAQLIYWDNGYGRGGLGQAGNLGVLSYFPTLIGGQVYNISCGCPTGCCTCEADCEVLLPGPICEIVNLTVDGVVQPPTNYTVFDGDTLVIREITKAGPLVPGPLVPCNCFVPGPPIPGPPIPCNCFVPGPPIPGPPIPCNCFVPGPPVPGPDVPGPPVPGPIAPVTVTSGPGDMTEDSPGLWRPTFGNPPGDGGQIQTDLSTPYYATEITIKADTAFVVPEWNLSAYQGVNSASMTVSLTSPQMTASFGVAQGTLVTGPLTGAPIAVAGGTITPVIVSGSIRIGAATGGALSRLPGDPAVDTVVRFEHAGNPLHNIFWGFTPDGSWHVGFAAASTNIPGPLVPCNCFVPGPDIPGPDIPGPDIPGPDVPGPDIPGPDIPGPPVPGPDVPGPPIQTFTTAVGCPGCQNYNLPLGEVGTWSVTYKVGTPVPDDINFAAGLYACEIAKALVGDQSCALSTRVQNVVRQGQTVAFFDPTALVNFGLTGIPLVDQIIRAVNPYRLAQDARVWFPGMTSTVRRET